VWLPVTLDLHLKAQGLTAAQLPDLNSPLTLPQGAFAGDAGQSLTAEESRLQGKTGAAVQISDMPRRLPDVSKR